MSPEQVLYLIYLDNDVISGLKKFITYTLFFAAAWASPSFSHHGNFTYDGNTVITLQGEVIKFNYTNPHGSIILRTETGREVDIEVDGPSLIAPMGTDRNALQPGDRIVVYVSPNNIGRENDDCPVEPTRVTQKQEERVGFTLKKVPFRSQFNFKRDNG